MTHKVLIPKHHLQLIHDECIRHSPNEACGVLVGRYKFDSFVVEKVVPITNSKPSDRSFELDPKEQYNAWVKAEKEGRDIVGVYHTHPRSHARPSLWDKETMENYQTLWIIAGIDGIHGYHWDNGIQPVDIVEVM